MLKAIVRQVCCQYWEGTQQPLLPGAYHVDANGSMSDNQYGFRRGRSTRLNRLWFVRNAKTDSDYSAAIFLDISDTFDHTWWPQISNRYLEHVHTRTSADAAATISGILPADIRARDLAKKRDATANSEEVIVIAGQLRAKNSAAGGPRRETPRGLRRFRLGFVSTASLSEGQGLVARASCGIELAVLWYCLLLRSKEHGPSLGDSVRVLEGRKGPEGTASFRPADPWGTRRRLYHRGQSGSLRRNPRATMQPGLRERGRGPDRAYPIVRYAISSRQRKTKSRYDPRHRSESYREVVPAHQGLGTGRRHLPRSQARTQEVRHAYDQHMLRLRHFPSQWKLADVAMIPKPGQSHNWPQNYRPISLLPIMSKIAASHRGSDHEVAPAVVAEFVQRDLGSSRHSVVFDFASRVSGFPGDEGLVVDGTRGVGCVPYAVVYRTDVGRDLIPESGPRHRLARPGFLVFWSRLSKLQQHRVVVGREFVEDAAQYEVWVPSYTTSDISKDESPRKSLTKKHSWQDNHQLSTY
ncbi:hypothetical protein Trydic_g10968 [Trypoxylus dichotomus]